MLGKGLGRASWSARRSTLRPGSARAGSLDVAPGSEVRLGLELGLGQELGMKWFEKLWPLCFF